MNREDFPDKTNEAPRTPDENIKKLAASGIPSDFVKKHNGEWDHKAWLDLCSVIDENGYTPINFDQVGLLLEDERAIYFNNRGKS